MVINQRFTNSQRKWILFGTIMAAVGCFVPWEAEGDFVTYWTYGIQLKYFFADNGGVTVLLFCILIFGLLFRSSKFTKYPNTWILVCSVALTMLVAYHFIDIWLRHIAAGGIIGAPTTSIG
jgi:hypothetical protein